MHYAKQTGATLVEVLVAIALTGIMLPAFAEAILTSDAARPNAERRLQADALEREAMEAVRVVREAGWSNVSTAGTYHPVQSGNTWTLTSGSETISTMTRQITISDVRRDATGAIVASGGTNDPSTKYVVATVSWSTPYPGSLSENTFLTRWQKNATWVQTTQADFNAGTFNNTLTTNTSGGEVTLNGGGSGVSWATPSQSGSLKLGSKITATNVYTDATTNRAYITTSKNLSIVDVSTPTAPVLLGTFSSASQLNSVYVAGNYAYVASAGNALIIINVSNPAAPVQTSSLSLGTNVSATSVFVASGYAYVGKALGTGSAKEFYIVNVSNPAAPTITGSLALSGAVTGIYVSGNYAYLATAITTAELTVINISTKSAPAIAGTYNSAGTAGATSVYYDGLYVYLGEPNNTGGPEFFILNAANPAAISLVGSYEMGANINGLYVVGSEAFLATSATGQQFAVLSLATISTPTLEGANNQPSANAVFVANNTAYIASSSTTTQFLIMQPSASTGGQSASGTYESPTFDAGSLVSFNAITFTTSQPSGTTITFQVAINNDNATWNYVGPDGTALTSYSAPGAISLLVANNRYFRYKASLSTTSKSTLPVIDDVTLNYSP